MLVALATIAAAAGEDASAPAFGVGQVVTFDQVEQLRSHLPPELWSNRALFFYPGMRLEVAETGDYRPAAAYVEATERFRGQPRIGPDGSLENYTAGQPFPLEEVDCADDPLAGAKVMWDFDHQWEGDGRQTSFRYTYWDRGERLPIYYEGTSKLIWLSNRVESDLLEERGGDLLDEDRRKTVYGIDVHAPFDSRGTSLLTYRYKSSEGPRDAAKNDDTWVYVPAMRRVRRIATAQRTDAVAGTDFTLDDLRGFSGIVPQYDWTCLGRFLVLAPMNSQVRAYPYDEGHRFGPSGLSFVDDRWELRTAVKVRMQPKNDDHPYQRKDLYLDAQTLVPLYSFAYDRNGDLWKVILHNNRWSEASQDPDYYPGWSGVPEPRDLKVVSDIVLNVQTGTGNRIELWDAHGTPLDSRAKIRKYIDVRRLNAGR
jgi:hypothetical protein